MFEFKLCFIDRHGPSAATRLAASDQDEPNFPKLLQEDGVIADGGWLAGWLGAWVRRLGDL